MKWDNSVSQERAIQHLEGYQEIDISFLTRGSILDYNVYLIKVKPAVIYLEQMKRHVMTEHLRKSNNQETLVNYLGG